MTPKTKMEKIINSSYNNIGGIIVQKNGKIVYENYLNDSDAASSFHVFSVTKSIVGILMGIAIDKGYIKSIDEKVLNFFPDYAVKQGEKTIQNITLKDLMTMTAPYKYKLESAPYTEYFTSDNWVRASLDFLGGKGKIGEFRYAPLIGPDIMTGILVKATGRSVLDFATEYLFSPLEITQKPKIVFRNKEEQLAFYEARNVSGWVVDPTGVNTGGWGLTLTTSEMVKLGQLYLDRGRWNGRQLVSEKWVDESTKEQSRCKQFKMSYGYLWWIIDEKDHVYAAMGDGGNIIYVNAKKNMVIAIASLFNTKAKDRIKLIKEYMEPVFEDCE